MLQGFEGKYGTGGIFVKDMYSDFDIPEEPNFNYGNTFLLLIYQVG